MKWKCAVCCKELKNNPCIEFTNEYLESVEEDAFPLPQVCTRDVVHTTSYEDDFEDIYNYPIQYCPHCGQPIEISVIKTIDCSKQYEELEKEREELSKKVNETDSKIETKKLKEQIKTIHDSIEDFYHFNEWKPN